MYSRLILKDRPDIVWPFENINESSSISLPINFYSNSASQYAASISAANTVLLNIPIVFGGGTALRLTSSATPNISIPLLSRFSELYDKRESCIEFWLRCDKVPSREVRIATKRNNPNIGLYLKDNYLMFRYGTSTTYIEAAYGMAELNEPTHIVMNQNRSGIELIVNGVSTITNNFANISLPIDTSHSTNDYMDFYGSSDYAVVVDSIALYAFNIRSNTAKTHYVYGLGKSVNENIFISLGGDFYNFSTQASRKSFYALWDQPQEWSLTQYDNLIHSSDGIRPIPYDVPSIVSFDNKINTSNNVVAFTSSAGDTYGTYLEVENLQSLLGQGGNPFFVEVRLNGTLPQEGLPQTIMSYGQAPFSSVIDFNFANFSGSYYLVAKSNVSTSSARFWIPNITSSPTIVTGMNFENQSIVYFGLSGSTLQTASLVSFSGSVFDADPISSYFPPTDNTVIRIGSGLTYDDSSVISSVNNVAQFNGTFLSFIITKDNFSGSTFVSVDQYEQPVYSLIYDSTKGSFRNRSFGNANFILHGAALGEYLDSGSAIISANRFEFGYPDVISASQVKIYASLYNYSSSVAIRSRVQLQKVNSLEWLNLIDLSDKYIQFDIDILADDVTNYAPIIKYFKIETYPFSGSYVEILDNSGDRIRINSASVASAQIYVPELDLTPTTYLTDGSGVRIYRNTADVEFSPASKSLDPTLSSNLLLWYDSRFPNGLGQDPHPDGSASNRLWTSLSGSAITASVLATANNPEYRYQSLNILTVNQANGSESGSVTDFLTSNASAQSSTETASGGVRSIKVVPSGTSADSFIEYFYDLTSSSAKRFIFPGQQYTVIGNISLLKTQSVASASARRIGLYAASTSPLGVLLSSFSASVPNEVGTYFASVTMTVPSGTNWLSFRFYNGSSVSGDPVYWDNMAIYSGSTVSGSPIAWYEPLELFDDRPTYKFNGLNHYFTSSVTINQPMTVYVVGRAFDSNNTIVGHSASAPAIYTENNTFRMAAGQVLVGASINNNFNILVGVFNNNSSSFFVNSSVVSGNAGTGSYSSAMRIGYRQDPSGTSRFLNGDVSGVLVFNTAHTKTEIDRITDWMKDAYNITW